MYYDHFTQTYKFIISGLKIELSLYWVNLFWIILFWDKSLIKKTIFDSFTSFSNLKSYFLVFLLFDKVEIILVS